jgi:radical SAM protein with 4Fe4S-binding SPASM domain
VDSLNHSRRGQHALSSKYVVENNCKIYSSPEIVTLVHESKTTSLNHHAMFAISLCNGDNTLGDIIDALAKKYDIGEESITNMISYIQKLYIKGILVDSKASVSPPDWLRSYRDSISKGIYHPHSLSIELTNYCNIECTFCYRDATRKIADDYVDIISLLRIKSLEGVSWVEFTGGEPLLHPDIYEILSFALEEYQYIGIITNGLLLSDSIIELLAKYKKKTFIQISLPTINKSRYKRLTGSDSIGLVLENIKKVCQKGIRLRVATLILDEESIDEFDKIADRVIEMGVNLISPGAVVDYGRGGTINSPICISSATNLTNKLEVLKAKYGNKIGWEPYNKESDSNSSRINCGAGSSKFCYNPKGIIRPCPMFPPDFSAQVNIDPTLIKRMRELPEPGGNECLDCEYYYNCKGCILKGWTKAKEIGEECSWAITNSVLGLFQEWEYSSDDSGTLEA